MPSFSSAFSSIEPGSPVEVTEMCREYKEDKDPKKANLSVGGYYAEDGSIYNFRVVKKVEKSLCDSPNHAYMPPNGFPELNEAVFKLAFGKSAEAWKKGFCVQSLGGTGPLRVGAEFLREHLGVDVAYYSNPTWINHRDIFRRAGFAKVDPYPYWDYRKNKLDFEGMAKFLYTVVEENSVIIFHASVHNPTGMNLNRKQWKEIANIVIQRGLFPFFDLAYHGFGEGGLEDDVFPLRHFREKNIEFFVSQSFGKNVGLYGERIGFLSGGINEESVVPRIYSQLINISRPMYSNPAHYGARILSKILLDPGIFQAWTEELEEVRQNLKRIRKRMRLALERTAKNKNWSGLTEQSGMFYFSGLSEEQGLCLKNRFHIYILPSSGRINLGAVNGQNIDFICEALAYVVDKKDYLSSNSIVTSL